MGHCEHRKMGQLKIKIVLLILIGIFFNSCSLDVTEKHYSDFDDAVKNEFNGNGYIPTRFMKKSIKEIRTFQNMDTGEALIRFHISDTSDWNELVSELTKCDTEFEKPKTLKMPDWWNIKITKDNKFCFTGNDGHKYNFIVDVKQKLIFGWN
jgi:hypothetical protein